MNKLPQNNQNEQSIGESIELQSKVFLQHLFGNDTPSFLPTEEVLQKMRTVIAFMTEKQRDEMSKKVIRCKYYEQLKAKGASLERIRSSMRIKFQISRYMISEICSICERGL